MPVKYKVNCTICQECRGNKKLRARIDAAFFRRDDGDENISDIALAIGKTRSAMYNHCKKHLRAPRPLTPVRVEGHIERLKAKIAKETELALEHDKVVPRQDFEIAIDSVIAEGLDQMKKNEKNISVSQLLAASKIKADYSAKKRGQNTELIKTMYRYAGGQDKEKENKDGTTPGPTESTDTGPNGPSDLHNQALGYALTRGTNPLSEGNTAS